MTISSSPEVRRPGFDRWFALAEWRERHVMLAILAIAFFVRVAAVMLFGDIDPKSAQIWEYGQIAATSLKHGGSMVQEYIAPDGETQTYPTAFMPPLGVYLWLALFYLFGVTKTALGVMLALNVLCGTAICYCVIRIANGLFGRSWIGLLAGIIAALHPIFVFSVATFHTVNLYVLLLLVIFLLCFGRSSQGYGRAALVGVLGGLATLERTEYLILSGALMLASLSSHRRLSITAVSIFAAAAIVLPWTVRNYLVMDRFIPVANVTGYALFKGFNPEANGSGWWVDNNNILEKRLGPELAAVPFSKHYESDRDDVMRDHAKRYIAEHPYEAYVLLPLKKLLLFWAFDFHDPKTRTPLYQLAIWPVTLFALLGFVLAARRGLLRRAEHRSVLILFAAQSLVMTAYAVHARYRMNVEPWLFAYAAFAVVCLVERAGPRLTEKREASGTAPSD